MDSGSADTTDVAAMIAFLERRVPGQVAAGLLRQESQELDGLKVTAPAPQNSGTFHHVPGQSDWRPEMMPWPRRQWEFQPATSATSRQGGLLVGDGPSFESYEAAFSAFFLAAAPSNMANQQPLWRILSLDRRAWLHRVTVYPDAVTVVVKGAALYGVRLELTTPTDRTVRPIGRTGRVKIRLPQGLAPSSLLLLRHGDEWLDCRHFYSSGPGQRPDPSVTWHQPEAEVGLLIAGGESQHVEFKREVPTTDGSGKTVLKTIAAFASGDGGTVLFGVADDAEIVGVDPTNLDGLKLAIGNMVRDSIDPEPPYTCTTCNSTERRCSWSTSPELDAGTPSTRAGQSSTCGAEPAPSTRTSPRSPPGSATRSDRASPGRPRPPGPAHPAVRTPGARRRVDRVARHPEGQSAHRHRASTSYAGQARAAQVGEVWVRVPHVVQAVGGLILILALVRLLNLEAVAAGKTPDTEKGEAMATVFMKSKILNAVAAVTETAWMYGVGVMAAHPLPGRHVRT